jgi:hypothetical protein
MTVAPQAESNLPANPEDFAVTGLEDFELTDAVIPRINIVHKEGVYKDNLSGQTFSTLRLIIVGLVKQRILWHPDVDESKDSYPMCKSPNHETGYPNLEITGKKAFPWDKAGFDPNNFPQVGAQKPLPCANCQLKEWGTHPTQDTPYCAEQFTLPIFYDADPEYQGNYVPAILTLQKSSIKPIRSYLTSFARSNKPAFTAICDSTLKVQTRGQVDYSVPSFVQVGESPRERWHEFSQAFAQMKSYLTSPPRSDEEDVPAASNNENTAPDPWEQAQQAQAAPVQQPPAQQAPPPPPPQPAPVAEAPPVQQPPAQAAPPPPPAPPAPPAPPVQQPPAAQAPPPPPQSAPPAPPAPTAAPPAGNDDLPF